MTVRRYDSYRDSGAEWLGEVPSHWEVRPLRYLAKFVSGGTPSKEKLEYWDGEIPWASAKDLKTDVISDTIDRLSEVVIKEGVAQLIPADAVLVLVRGMMLARAFPVSLTGRPMAINQDLKALLPSDGVLARFLCWSLQASESETLSRLDEAGHGTKALRMDKWTSMAMPMPPPSEQVAITVFLDRETAKIDALVEAQRRLIELLKEKRQAVISHAVTKGLDPTVPMKESGLPWPERLPEHWQILPLTRVIARFVDYRGSTPNKVEVGVPLITATQIKGGKINFYLDPVYITEEEYFNRMTRGFPEIGDLLLTTEAPLGEVALVENSHIAPGQRIILMKVDKSYITSEFLRMHYISQFGQNELWTRASGSTASGIRSDRLRAGAVLVPPLDEQRSIVSHIEREVAGYDVAELDLASQMNLLQERRAALISAAVTGKIDVRNAIREAEAA